MDDTDVEFETPLVKTPEMEEFDAFVEKEIRAKYPELFGEE